MSGPDWAEVEAKQFLQRHCCHLRIVEYLDSVSAVASALRAAELRGRIAGLREALGYGAMSKSYRALSDVLDRIELRARELEKQKP